MKDLKDLGNSALIEELRRRLQENRVNSNELEKLSLRLEEVNRKLAESEAHKGHFISNIRNEINNPLTAILGLSQNLMQTDSIATDTLHHLASLLYREAFNLDFQLRTIFAAAEIESGEMEIHATRVDMIGTIERVVRLFQIRAAEKNIWLGLINNADMDDPSLRYCMTDAEKTALILSNLVNNAIEFSRPESRVLISYEPEDTRIGIAVQDSGIGIAEADKERIFDRFVQLETGATKNHAGHGLGLSVVKSLIEQLGGAIHVESTPGRGSRFTIMLPVKRQNARIETLSLADNEEVF